MELALGNHNFCRNPGGAEVRIKVFLLIGILLNYWSLGNDKSVLINWYLIELLEFR